MLIIRLIVILILTFPRLAAAQPIDDDTGRIIGWLVRIEEGEGLRVRGAPILATRAEMGTAERQFYLISQWATELERTTDPAASYFAAAVRGAAFAQLYAARGEMADARNSAREALTWLDRTQAAFNHH